MKLIFFLCYICAQRNLQRIYFYFALSLFGLCFSNFRRLRNNLGRWFCGCDLNSFLKISKLILIFFIWYLIYLILLFLNYGFNLFLFQWLRLGHNFFWFLFLFNYFFLIDLICLIQIILLYFNSLLI